MNWSTKFNRIVLNPGSLVLSTTLLLIITLFMNSCASASSNPMSITTNAAETSEQNSQTTPPLSSILNRTVVFIYEDKTPLNSLKLIPGRVLGTAFIVGIPMPGNPEKSFPFIATAKHVVAGRTKVLVRFTLKSGSEPGFARYDLEQLRGNADLWESDDEGVDLIVFRTLAYQVVEFVMFPIELIASKEAFSKENINVSDRVVIPCLMQNYPGVSQNYPIFRDGSIALITEEPISFKWNLGKRQIETSQKLVFINSILNEGFSGAPVLFWPGVRSTQKGIQFGGKPWLIGIVHGFFPNLRKVIDAEGNDVTITKVEPEKLPRKINVFSQENSGTGIIFPAWRLLEILESDAIKKRVQKLTEDAIAKEKMN